MTYSTAHIPRGKGHVDALITPNASFALVSIPARNATQLQAGIPRWYGEAPASGATASEILFPYPAGNIPATRLSLKQSGVPRSLDRRRILGWRGACRTFRAAAKRLKGVPVRMQHRGNHFFQGKHGAHDL